MPSLFNSSVANEKLGILSMVGTAETKFLGGCDSLGVYQHAAITAEKDREFGSAIIHCQFREWLKIWSRVA